LREGNKFKKNDVFSFVAWRITTLRTNKKQKSSNMMNCGFTKPVWLGALLLFALTCLSGCTYEQITPTDTGEPASSGICFETDILPIFQSNCTQSGCHNSKDRRDGYDLSNYNGIMKGIVPGNYRKSEIYESLIETGDDRMPPFPYEPLRQADISLIAQWIQEGAKNTVNCGNTAATCDVANVTYAGTVAPLMAKYCNGCHTGTTPQGNIRTGNYTALKALSSKPSFMGSMRHLSGYSPMPRNATKLSTCQLDQIQKWLDLGAKND
jgi:mono/diheme cytochrome c family protein